MKNKTLTYLALSLLCCFCSCTSVDLCPEEGHPHITDMRVRLNWGDTDKDEIPAVSHNRKALRTIPKQKRETAPLSICAEANTIFSSSTTSAQMLRHRLTAQSLHRFQSSA